MEMISEWKRKKEWRNPVSVLELKQKAVRIPNGTRGSQMRFASMPFVTFLLSFPSDSQEQFCFKCIFALKISVRRML